MPAESLVAPLSIPDARSLARHASPPAAPLPPARAALPPHLPPDKLANLYSGTLQSNGLPVDDTWPTGTLIAEIARELLPLLLHPHLAAPEPDATPALIPGSRSTSVADRLYRNDTRDRIDSAIPPPTPIAINVTDLTLPRKPPAASSWIEPLMNLTSKTLANAIALLNDWRTSHRYDARNPLQRHMLSVYLLHRFPLILFDKLTADESDALLADHATWLARVLDLPDPLPDDTARHLRALVGKYLVKIGSVVDLDRNDIEPPVMYAAWRATTRPLVSVIAASIDDAPGIQTQWDRIPRVVQDALGALFAVDELGNVISPLALLGSRTHCSFKLRIDRIRGGRATDVDNVVARAATVNSFLAGKIEQLINPATWPKGLALHEFLHLLLDFPAAMEPLLGFDPGTDAVWLKQTNLPKMNYGFFHTAGTNVAKIQFQHHLTLMCHFLWFRDHLLGVRAADPSLVKKWSATPWGRRVLTDVLVTHADVLGFAPDLVGQLRELAEYGDSFISDQTLAAAICAVDALFHAPPTSAPAPTPGPDDGIKTTVIPIVKPPGPSRPSASKLDRTILRVAEAARRIFLTHHLSIPVRLLSDCRHVLAAHIPGTFPSIQHLHTVCLSPADASDTATELALYTALAVAHRVHVAHRPSHAHYSVAAHMEASLVDVDVASPAHLRAVVVAWCARIAHLQARFPLMRLQLVPQGAQLVDERGFFDLPRIARVFSEWGALSGAGGAGVGPLPPPPPVVAVVEGTYLAPRKVLRDDAVLRRLVVTGIPHTSSSPVRALGATTSFDSDDGQLCNDDRGDGVGDPSVAAAHAAQVDAPSFGTTATQRNTEVPDDVAPGPATADRTASEADLFRPPRAWWASVEWAPVHSRSAVVLAALVVFGIVVMELLVQGSIHVATCTAPAASEARSAVGDGRTRCAHVAPPHIMNEDRAVGRSCAWMCGAVMDERVAAAMQAVHACYAGDLGTKMGHTHREASSSSSAPSPPKGKMARLGGGGPGRGEL
ncbi:hypothetical protein AMAG_14684 [Allomyces macrogynus ATCC 38327]|uniref:Uncharacterized protein n=1 Tax=Allomyces macrogynus (strain ATCC 38327) TaxID=578462 RepID=A0A0L0T743_ALLM3|nr:hypothetical protein AMAG_14684 [Allomyces macrogynus ATCC 38327]|eukprot:KNE70562.1 hypothetical protein AMAG_14684 [Allomyces macrogynus ATCC 38327]